MIFAATDRLAPVSQESRDAAAASVRSLAHHDTLMEALPAMNRVEIGGAPGRAGPLDFPFTVAAWNLERCLFPDASASRLAATGAAIVLLSEMDAGMARTLQRHTAAEIAAALGMEYAYGVEFLELGLGPESEQRFRRDDFNALGFHGNALLAGVPLTRPFLVRLWGERIWLDHNPEQRRIGERCAVGALIETVAGPFVAVSVHLESAARAPYRERQCRDLIDAIDAAFPGLPVLIGGDLNTGNGEAGDFEVEGLFRASAARGFVRHSGPLDGMTTRPSLMSRAPRRPMKLDWFLARGLDVVASSIVPALDDAGGPLSDHEMITCTVAGFL
jgi:endonuclease/exonuclease/phosphatase family metal-dependent hydrolase